MTEIPSVPAVEWPNLSALGRELEVLDRQLRQALDHVDREMRAAPAEMMAQDTSAVRGGGSTVSDPVGELASKRYEMRARREDMRDAALSVQAEIRALAFIIGDVLRSRLPDKAQLPGMGDPDFDAAREARRCKVDPTCTNVASPHRHPDTGSEVSIEACDDCWRDRVCKSCRERPRDGRHLDCRTCQRNKREAA